MKRILFYLIQWTWGLLQNIAGLIFMLCLGRQRRGIYHGALITYYKGKPKLSKLGNCSLGMFIFINGENSSDLIESIAVHEYGHSIQSLITGPLYLAVIGLPSLIWARRFALKRKTGESCDKYTSRYPERQANTLGERTTGGKPVRW